MNGIKLIGAVSTPPLIEKIAGPRGETPKLRFTLAAAYMGFDGQPRMWRHDIDLFGNASSEIAPKVEAGGLLLVQGALSVRSFQNRRTGQMEQAFDIKPEVIMPLSKTLVGVTRRDEGHYVADETVLNEAEVAGPLKSAPYKGTDDNHPLVVEVVTRGIHTKNESIVKGKTWDEGASAKLDNTFEGSLVLLRGMLVNEFHKDENSGQERSGTYVRFNDAVKL